MNKKTCDKRTCIVEACKGDENAKVKDKRNRVVVDGIPRCTKITSDGFCKTYLWPEKKWRNGACPLSPMAFVNAAVKYWNHQEGKVNPLKMSKRGLS